MLGYEAGRRNRVVASRLEKARVTGKCGAAELGKRGAACGVIGTLTCGGCAPSSPSWRALCARAKRRRVARTSSLNPSLAPQMRPPDRIESTGGCGFSSRSILVASAQCGAGAVDFAAGLASIRPAVGFLRSRAYPSTRVDDERAGGVYRKRAVLSATFRETWKTDDSKRGAALQYTVPCSIWVADPILDNFLTAQLCQASPAGRVFF